MYTPRQSIAVSTKSCPYDGIPFLSALRPYMEAARSMAHAKQTSHRHSNGRQARHINSGRLLRRHLAGFYTAVDT